MKPTPTKTIRLVYPHPGFVAGQTYQVYDTRAKLLECVNGGTIPARLCDTVTAPKP